MYVFNILCSLELNYQFEMHYYKLIYSYVYLTLFQNLF